jgi:hypothetical protein
MVLQDDLEGRGADSLDVMVAEAPGVDMAALRVLLGVHKYATFSLYATNLHFDKNNIWWFL